jgi:hypothetical protein
MSDALKPCPFCGDEGEKGRQTVSQISDVLPPLENPHSYRTAANAYRQWEDEHADENKRRAAGIKNEFVRLTCRVCGAMCPEANWNCRTHPPIGDSTGKGDEAVEITAEMVEAAYGAYLSPSADLSRRAALRAVFAIAYGEK